MVPIHMGLSMWLVCLSHSVARNIVPRNIVFLEAKVGVADPSLRSYLASLLPHSKEVIGPVHIKRKGHRL